MGRRGPGGVVAGELDTVIAATQMTGQKPKAKAA